MKTYYDILGVDEKADKKTIRKAFRELAKKFHPDIGKQKGKDYSKIFEEITVAYSILSDEEKRKAYDESLKKKEKVNFLNHFRFKELMNLTISIEKFFSKKVFGLFKDRDVEKISIEELLDRIMFSNNIYVQKHAVMMIFEKRKFYAIRDLLRLLYFNLNEEIKLFIIEEIKRRKISHKTREVLSELYNIEKNQKIKNALSGVLD